MRLRWYDDAVGLGSLIVLFAVALYMYHFVPFKV